MSPAFAAPNVVTASVCGMISTENVVAGDLVDGERDAVERTEPFGAMKRVSAFGARSMKRA